MGRNWRVSLCGKSTRGQRQLWLRTRDLRQQFEETALSYARDRPVHRHTLVSFIEALAFHAKIEIPPRNVLAHSRNEIVLRLLKIKVIIFVDDNRHGTERRQRARLADQIRDILRLVLTIAVNEHEIRDFHD